MKKLLLASLLCLGLLPCYAQFKLSGTIINQTKTDTFYVNIPYVYGYYAVKKVAIPVDAHGNFNTDIKVNEQHFATLYYRGIKTTLLLKPGKNLNINLNPIDSSITLFKGTTATENQLLYNLNLEATPFFARYKIAENPYRGLTADEVPQKIYQPIMAERDKRLALIASSALSLNDKKLIAQEVRAQAINQMTDYTRAYWKVTSRKDLASLITIIFKDNSPKPEAMPAGPRFYAFAEQYMAYLETTTMTEYEQWPAATRNKTPLKAYGLSLDSGNRVVTQKGKAYLNWLAIRNNYEKPVAEALLAQFVMNDVDQKMLDQARFLVDDMRQLYPQSKYLPGINQQMQSLEDALVANERNKEIRIAEGYDQITSIYQILPQLKGKVIYLDIWGTWCGPCKEELTYNPQLKAHFKGKDVAFVYLDMDEDTKDASWREFLKVNGLTGLHLRKSNKEIQNFWQELQPDEKRRGTYPTYFIFDKTGKLVQTDAKRPSDRAELYKQIEQYL